MDPDLYKRALDFAARAHGDQRVPGSGFPYVVHLAKVAMEALRACAADESLDADLTVACALLHDSVEDAGIAPAEIEASFGARVAAGVAALSKDPALPASARMPDCLARIRAQPHEVWVVKLADRITNLEPAPASWSAEKRIRYLVEAAEIGAALGSASPILEARLNEKMLEYERTCRA